MQDNGMFSTVPDDIRELIERLRRHVSDVMLGRKILRTTSWKGYRFIPLFEAETAKYGYDNYEVEDGAVFIITYPKTGTNWCTEVVRRIIYGRDEAQDAMHKALTPALFDFEMAFKEKFKILDHIPIKRKIFRSHLPEELVNVEKIRKNNGKIIIVLRNPKDQAVSWYNFTGCHNHVFDGAREEFSRDWNEFFDSYVNGRQPTISKEGQWYLDHILGWYQHKDDENVLFVYFEDMKRSITTEIERMANFLDVKLREEEVAEIARMTSFDFMKEQSEKHDSDMSKARSMLKLLRKGTVGQWKEYFTATQSEMVDQLVEAKLGNTDIKFTYEL